MAQELPVRIDEERLRSKELHDLMLAVPVRDGFCRFYGSYVPVGGEACFPEDHKIHECIATDTFKPTDKSC